MACVIFRNVPIYGSPAIAKQDLLQNLKCSDNIDPIEIIFLQNNQSVQDAEVQLKTIEDKQYLIENSPLEYCFNGDPATIVKLNIVESYKK